MRRTASRSIQRGLPGLSLPRYEIDIAKGTVPAGRRFIMLARQGGELAAKVSHILFYTREYGSVWQLKRDIVLKDSHFYVRMAMPWVIPAKADLEVRATATGGSGILFGGFAGFFEENK